MTDKENLHEGHRQRLKNRFLESGFNSFETHNILELLLFYSIPRKDTNEIAHDLLKHFGTLRGVFEAEVSELTKVKGISESSATLIKMIPAIAREYLSDKHANTKVFDKAEIIAEYLMDKFFGETKEIVYVMLLNNNFELINMVKLHEGNVNSAHLSPRQIIDLVVRYNAGMVIIAHNHPNGNAFPSMEDIETTDHLMKSLKPFDVPLIEHFIVTDNEYYPIIFNTSSLKLSSKETCAFYRRSMLKDEN